MIETRRVISHMIVNPLIGHMDQKVGGGLSFGTAAAAIVGPLGKALNSTNNQPW